MNKEQLGEIATVNDLKLFKESLVGEIKEIIFFALHPQKEFYTPKEFASITGSKYSTIVDHCKKGKLKARQSAPNSTWFIYVSEVERYKQEANDNSY